MKKLFSRVKNSESIVVWPLKLQEEVEGSLLPINKLFFDTSITYGATITLEPEEADIHKISVTNGVAFTISNPTGLTLGQNFILQIKNDSGGVMGTITWGSMFKLAGGSWTNPANTKRRLIAFWYDGTDLVELFRSSADI